MTHFETLLQDVTPRRVRYPSWDWQVDRKEDQIYDQIVIEVDRQIYNQLRVHTFDQVQENLIVRIDFGEKTVQDR